MFQELIVNILNETLGGKLYDSGKVSGWSKTIADLVKSQVKTLGYERYSLVLLFNQPINRLDQPANVYNNSSFSRYKIVVEVVIGEQRGEGVRMGSRCLWDSDTDNYASEVYMNDSLFCCTAVFGLYYY